jgi:hypothetical protein
MSLESNYSVSVNDPSVDCRTLAGRWVRLLILSKAEEFSDMQSETQKVCVKVAIVDRHQWIGLAPLGYTNNTSKGGTQPNIIPEEPQFTLMHDAFVLSIVGTHPPAQLHREMTRRGLRSKKGWVLTFDTFIRYLRNPGYVGKIPSVKHGIQQGCHQPCVSQETFDAVQTVLSGMRPTHPLKSNYAHCVKHGQGFHPCA